MIRVTDKAVSKFKEVIQNAGEPANAMLRVGFGGFGWGGPRFELTLDESVNETDVLIENGEIKVVYDSQLNEYLETAVIDYSDSWFSRGFRIIGGGISHC